MRKIELVDLKNQYLGIKTEVDEAIRRVIDSTGFIGGADVAEFGNELGAYLGSKHVVPCANGTDALQICMMALGLEPGDEVITPSFTYFATVEVIALLKLTPVFVEVDAKTFTMDPAAMERAITPKTKAIVPVHLYGQSADMEKIMAVAAKHNLPVIEDNAQAIGGWYQFADGKKAPNGTMGTAGCTSFFPSKNLGAYGDGGAMYTNDEALALKLKMLANHGQRIKYYHDLVGCNSRLDSLQAAILRVKLKHLDEYVAKRRAAADYYDNAFAKNKKITTPFRAANAHHVFHQYTLLTEGDRDGLVAHLQSKNIPSQIYYPVPCHEQKAFEGKGRVPEELKTTGWLTQRVISLPMHTELDQEQMKFITESVNEFIQ